jgi:O-antigen/teichoic acid export membrane protein
MNQMRSTVKKIYANEFLKGGVFLTTGSFLANILNYLFNVIAGRSLGPSGYGELATFFSYSIIVSVPLTVVSTILIQRISAAGENRFVQAYRYEVFFIEKIKKIWPFFLILIVFEPFIPRLTNLSPITGYSLIPFLLLSFPTTFFTASFQGLRLFALFSLYSLLTTFIKFLGAVLVGAGFGGIATIMTLLYASVIFMIVAGHLALRQNNTFKKNSGHSTDKKLRYILRDKQFITTTLSILAITLFNNIDIIFVKKYFLPSDAGIYASWSLFSKIILYTITPLISVSFVFFSGRQEQNKETQTIKASLIGLTVVAIGSLIVYSFFGNFLVSMFFGDKYKTVIPYLSKASLFGSFYTGIYFINNYLLAKKNSGALLLPIGVTFYIVTLFLFPKNIAQVVDLTTYSSGLMLAILVLFGTPQLVKS